MSEEDKQEEENKTDETVEETAGSNDSTETAESGDTIEAAESEETSEASTKDANAISGSAPAETAEIIAKSISGKDVNIDALLKVPVSLAIEVGRTRLNMSDLLNTREGSVIELDRHLDEPLDILVNGALIAHGIVVLANEKFGLQITDIVSLEERARSL